MQNFGQEYRSSDRTSAVTNCSQLSRGRTQNNAKKLHERKRPYSLRFVDDIAIKLRGVCLVWFPDPSISSGGEREKAAPRSSFSPAPVFPLLLSRSWFTLRDRQGSSIVMKCFILWLQRGNIPYHTVEIEIVATEWIARTFCTCLLVTPVRGFLRQ